MGRGSRTAASANEIAAMLRNRSAQAAAPAWTGSTGDEYRDPRTDPRTDEHILALAAELPARMFPYGQRNHRLADVKLIAESALLSAPSATGKEYRGYVGLGESTDGYVFVGATTYGPGGQGYIQYGAGGYEGGSLDDAIKTVNKVLKAKQTPRKGYEPIPGTGPALLDRDLVLANIRAALSQ